MYEPVSERITSAESHELDVNYEESNRSTSDGEDESEEIICQLPDGFKIYQGSLISY